MKLKKVVEDKKFWVASFLITWAAALQVISFCYRVISACSNVQWERFPAFADACHSFETLGFSLSYGRREHASFSSLGN
uniref:Similar to uncharacterized protein n=1 Tax=Lupinus angustifolius TaxID=3871 RepID=A0A0D6DQJ6_LUPAN|nr:similar to uncharacterized protein [Lupinus angustifolius]